MMAAGSRDCLGSYKAPSVRVASLVEVSSAVVDGGSAQAVDCVEKRSVAQSVARCCCGVPLIVARRGVLRAEAQLGNSALKSPEVTHLSLQTQADRESRIGIKSTGKEENRGDRDLKGAKRQFKPWITKWMVVHGRERRTERRDHEVRRVPARTSSPPPTVPGTITTWNHPTAGESCWGSK